MPANNNRQPASQTAASPSPKPPTSKYTNKDGTKTITVPKSSASTPPAQPSPTTTSSSKGGAPTNMKTNGSGDSQAAPTVNRKKQKRRAKAAAKAAAEAEAAGANEPNGLPSPASISSAAAPHPASSSRSQYGQTNRSQHSADVEDWDDDETESDVEHHLHSYNHHPRHAQTNGSTKSKKSKKKKKQKGQAASNLSSEFEQHPSGISNDNLWNTSNKTERERIRQFWLDLGEDERRSLVKVEKDAVLKKMKEQQKHTCSCTVCGRKRNAIEEELEGLYDAYYEELESFANQPQSHPHGPPMLGPRRLGQMTGLHPPRSLPSDYSNHQPSRGHIVEHLDNDDDEEEDPEDYSDDDELDDDELEEPEEQDPRESFFGFGSGLQVKGGILTVADDLLKNDGKKFIEMMEQLAERRMAREEDAKDHYPSPYNHPVNGGSIPNSHNHPPDEEEFDDDDEDDEDYDSQEEDYDEEEDAMTEEQRMEEGRRMFQIFAARMFEQRVLTAYREKVAKERQHKLLQELEEESRLETQRKAKKAKEAQKKKDKAAQKKQALAEEKARKEAEKAEEEAQRLAEEKRRTEEAKAKAEEKRKKKELQKKAEEEERLRKEAERQRRVHEQKERQAEHERKAREAKEREKKLKEEQRAKEKEAREQKERETRERREKHEKDKLAKEQRAAQAKAERDAKEKQKQEEKAAQKAAALAAPIPTQPAKKPQHPVSIPALPQQPPPNHASPQIAVATPALPKAPTPMKPRSVSQEVARSFSQASHSGSGHSQNASPLPLTPVHTSPGPIGPPRKTSSTGPTSGGPPTVPTSPLHASMKGPPGLSQPPFAMGMPPMGMPYPPGMPLGPGTIPGPPGFNPMHTPMFAPVGAGGFRPPGPMSLPPGLGAPGPMGRGFPMPHAPPPGFQAGGEPMPGMNQAFGPPDSFPTGQSPHSRQASASFDSGSIDAKGGSSTPALPVARPLPIGRPSSVVHGHRHSLKGGFDDVSDHLGSSALLDDSDDPLDFGMPHRGTAAPGVRPPFAGAPPFMDPVFGSPHSLPQNHGWGTHNPVFSPPPGFASSGWPTPAPFPPPGIRTMHVQPHSVAVRLMLCRTCKDLESIAADAAGFIDLSAIKGHVDSLTKGEPVSEAELLDMCETEGNHQNGGGTFEIRRDEATGKVSVRYDALAGSPLPSRNVGAPGEIGSPIPGVVGPVGSSFGARGL